MLRSGVSCLLSFTAIAAGFILSGCSTNSPIQTNAAVKGRSGSVHGGQQPISGATIQLYAVGTIGDGSAATPLLTQPVVSDFNGNFNITGLYTCQPTSSALVYITATGGSPASGITNAQIALMAALGPCNTLTASTFVNINEITTVAAVYSLPPFIASFSAIGSGTSDAAALASAFTYAGYIANTATGTTPGTGLPSNLSVPIAQVDTIADLLAACINSPGGVSGDTSICGTFFALTLPSGATAPTDTIGALINLANNPTLNTTALYNLIPPASPFQPVQPTIPPDLSLHLLVNSLFTVSPSTVDFASAVLDFTQPTQTVTVTNGTAAGIAITSASITGVNASDFAIVPPSGSDCGGTVPANSTCTFEISFIPSAPGARAAYFILANTSANPSIAIALAGSGTLGSAGPITLTPSSITLIPPNVVGPPIPYLTLTNSGTTTLTINSISTSNAGYVPNYNCGSTLAAGASCTISATVTTYSIPASATLTVVDDASTGPQTATLLFPEGGSPTYPLLVDFGHWAIGATGNEYLQILGTGVFGGYTFNITGPNAGDFSFSSTSALNSTTCTYEYRFNSDCLLNIYYKPSALITSTAYVNVVGFGQFTITGHADPAGVDFDIYQTPVIGPGSTYYAPPITSLNVGSTPIGTPVTTYFAVNNTGTAPLTFMTPVISGPNAADFTFPTSCASPCSTIVFTPSAAGTRSATITYTDTTNTVTRTLALIGTGY